MEETLIFSQILQHGGDSVAVGGGLALYIRSSFNKLATDHESQRNEIKEIKEEIKTLKDHIQEKRIRKIERVLSRVVNGK